MTTSEITKLSDQAKRLNMIFKDFEGAIRPFAMVLEVSAMSAHRMLKGKQAITFKVVNNVCSKLGYNPEWFIKGTGSKKQKAEDRGKILTDIAEFNTVLAILNKRIDVQDIRIKNLEKELDSFKNQVQKAV